jgi:hypothetical protein
MAMLVLGCGRTGLLDGTGTPDAGDDGREVTIPDGGDAASNRGPLQLAAAHNLEIYGVTDDGQIIYGPIPPLDIWAVSFTGGMPAKISPPGFATPGAPGYAGGAFVFHHVVVMSMVTLAVGQSSATPGTPVSTWDERTGVTTTFKPPREAYGSADSTRVSPDSQYVAIVWETTTKSGVPWSVSRVDGTDSVSFGPAYQAAFDQDRLVYSTVRGGIVGSPGAPLVALDGANGWSSVTLSTNASLYAVDGIGSRALVSNGPSPNGGQGVLLAPLDGGAPVVIDPTGGGPTLYLSPDSTFAMYTAEAGTANAHVAAVTLPTSGPPGTPYAATASALSAGAVDMYTGPVAVFPNAPTGPVAIFTVNSSAAPLPTLAIVGVGAGATSPDLAVPFSFLDGFTSDASRVLINRASSPNTAAALTVFPLPGGPESAPLSTSSYGWIALDGSTVVFTDKWVSGTSDLRIADLAKGTSSTLVVSAATSYAVSPDGKLLAYTYDRSGSSADGLWVTVLPKP